MQGFGSGHAGRGQQILRAEGVELLKLVGSGSNRDRLVMLDDGPIGWLVVDLG